ncbi:MAG: hypothetical protein LBM67_07980 [Lentimicrobiaceae bacterium]|nr:hypothetical protein [Lentimicrobiaceae bacterium]
MKFAGQRRCEREPCEAGSNPEKHSTHAGLLRVCDPRNDDRGLYKLKVTVMKLRGFNRELRQ